MSEVHYPSLPQSLKRSTSPFAVLRVRFTLLLLVFAGAFGSLEAARLFEVQHGIPITVETTNSEGQRVVIPEQANHLGGLIWIWSEEPKQPDFGLNAYYLSDPGLRSFHRVIEVDGPLPSQAQLIVSAAGRVDLSVNGETVGAHLAPDQVHAIDIASALRRGRNVFVLSVDNREQPSLPNPRDDRVRAGVVGRVILGKDIIPVDASWRVHRGAIENTGDLSGERLDWEQSVVVGPYGIAPWGQISGPLIPPPNFPRFTSPGFEREMELFREMALRYYRYGSVPTYKDMWMPESYLWIGLTDLNDYHRNETLWKQATLETHREIDEEGYVSTDQHVGLGHPRGWPFPFWIQAGGAGWPFSTRGFHYLQRANVANADPALWSFEGIEVLGREDPDGLVLRVTGENAFMDSPTININHRVSPFFTMEWAPKALADAVEPYLEWTTAEDTDFCSTRRVPFKFDADIGGIQRSYARLYEHPRYEGPITGFRIGFGNTRADAEIAVKILFTTQDTRHNGNNAQFIGGVHDIFAYTGDTDYLRAQMPRLRKALNYALDEFGIRELKHVRNPWIGHEGWPGIEYVNGEKVLHRDRGMGNNFWDLLPFGGNDFYSSMLYYVALHRMANIEEFSRTHPEWRLADADDAFDPDDLRTLAEEMKAHANNYFWNEASGRFPAAIDIDGVKHDYGFTFVNLEAIYYGFANAENARSIMEWITGVREVEGDTSQGADIYNYRFAPRATTKRNITYYKFAWAAPERLNFGDQIQDGGAVMGFSYHDLVARHRTMGPEVGWERLMEILEWYEDVWEVGGYRPYYEEHEGMLQSPLPGGLGLHREFTEPALMPLYALRGLFGLNARPAGFGLDPHFPEAVDDFTVDRVRFQDALLSLRYREGLTTVRVDQGSLGDLKLYLPEGEWEVAYANARSRLGESLRLTPGPEGTTVPLQIRGSDRLYLRGNSARVVELERQMKLNAERWAGRARSPHWEIGDSVLQVNFGAPETPEIEGWTLIGQEAFDPERGFGWESPPDLLRLRQKGNSVRERSMFLVTKDIEAPAVFRAEVEPGWYDARMAIGDPEMRAAANVYLGDSDEALIVPRTSGPGRLEVHTRKLHLADGILRLRIPPATIPGSPYPGLSWIELRPIKRLR